MAESHHEEEVLGKAYDGRLMRRLLKYLWPYKWHALTSLVLTILSAPLVLAGPPLMKAAIDLYLAPDPEKPPAGFSLLLKDTAEWLGLGGSPYEGLAFIAIVFFVANLAAFAVQYTQAYVMQAMGQYIMYDLRKEIFAHLQRLPVQFYDRNPVGRLMTRLTTDVDALNELFTSGVIDVLGDLVIIFAIVGMMFYLDWKLALVSLLTIPLLFAATNWFRKRARIGFDKVRTRNAKLNAFL